MGFKKGSDMIQLRFLKKKKKSFWMLWGDIGGWEVKKEFQKNKYLN